MSATGPTHGEASEKIADPRQLGLPLPGLIQMPDHGVGIPREDRVFVNRNLPMSNIQWIGFDMDYTLAIYHQRAMDALSVEQTVKRLVLKGYPRYLEHLDYDTRFPIRGLLIDKRHGHVLKMDRHKVVHKGYHGMRPLSKKDLEELYHHKKIRPHTKRYHWIDTLFALSEVTAYAAIVEAMERRGEHVRYEKLFHDVRWAIDAAHADGEVHGAILENLRGYIDRDELLARTLHKLRSAGKRLFLLTNSPYPYTQALLDYLLGSAMSEYPSWQHYFDIIICAAKKPLWFRDGTPLQLRSGDELVPATGALEKGRIYEGGNLRTFEQRLGIRGSSILYVGDHIYGDILRSKKESSWRTAMIIQELDAEIHAQENVAGEVRRQQQLELSRERLEDELRFYQGRFKEVQKAQKDAREEGHEDLVRSRVKRQLERVRTELRSVQLEYNRLDELIDGSFHPYWGSLLKQQHEMSSFGLQVELYADIYMRRVSSLNAYSPQQFFHSPRDLMPHEL